MTTPNAELSSGDNDYHLHEFTPSEMEHLLYNFKILDRCGVATDELSKNICRYIPYFLITLIKKNPFYSRLVRLLCKPKINRSINSETMIFIAKKS